MSKQKNFQSEILWKFTIYFAVVHLLALYSLTQLKNVRTATIVWDFVLLILSEIGTTAGAHRLWTHRSYKAKLPLRGLLAVMYSLLLQYSIFDWSCDHRIHHKYSDTNADPYNAKRGFFFSHIGWAIQKRHPKLEEKLKDVYKSDLQNDPVVVFQKKHWKIFTLFFSVFLPTVIPLLWKESVWLSFLMCFLRMVLNYNMTWTVNSVAHMWGNKPYDKSLYARENFIVKLLTLGEGFHNFHHAFPQDYAASEYGIKYNITTIFINTMAYFGLAYDCRTVDPKIIQERRQRTGEF